MKLAKETWKAIYEELYGRAEFDWWWDGMDVEFRDEINTAIESIIAAKMEPVRYALNGVIELVGRLDKVGDKAFADGDQGTILYETVCALRISVSDYGLVKAALAMLSEGE